LSFFVTFFGGINGGGEATTDRVSCPPRRFADTGQSKASVYFRKSSIALAPRPRLKILQRRNMAIPASLNSSGDIYVLLLYSTPYNTTISPFSAFGQSIVGSNPEQHTEYQSFATTTEQIENFLQNITDAGNSIAVRCRLFRRVVRIGTFRSIVA
jgi:hypothetical protein